MPRKVLIAALLASAGLTATAVHAAEPAPAAAHKPYSSTETALGELLDNPATKAILVKYVPQLADNPQIEMARGLTLKQVQGFAGDMLTDETLGKIDLDLAKLPAKH